MIQENHSVILDCRDEETALENFEMTRSIHLHPAQRGMLPFPGALLCLLCLAASCLLGCKPTASLDQAAPEVRGAPIRTVAAKKAGAAASSASALPVNTDSTVATPVSNASGALANSNPDPAKPLPLSFEQ